MNILIGATGALLVLAFVAVIFNMTMRDGDWREALGIWLFAIAMTGLLMGGVALVLIGFGVGLT